MLFIRCSFCMIHYKPKSSNQNSVHLSKINNDITKSQKEAVAEGLQSKEVKRSLEKDFMHKSLSATWHKLNSGTQINSALQSGERLNTLCAAQWSKSWRKHSEAFSLKSLSPLCDLYTLRGNTYILNTDTVICCRRFYLRQNILL